MSDITVIGLGFMGAALARAIQGAGHDLTVWNRSPDKMQPFIDAGAGAAPDVASAVTASPVILICIDGYAATKALMEADGMGALLSGRTVVQLSTGTPKEAGEAAEWMIAHDAHYLDGAILCYAENIGTDAANILLSGDAIAHEKTAELMKCFGGSVRYLGANVRSASALDLAWLTTIYGNFMTIIHAAKMCKSEGVALDQFMALFPDQPDLRGNIKIIHEESFLDRTATLQVWGAALERIRQQGVDAGINTEIPDFIAGIFKRAIDAGYGDENVMALVKVL